MSKFSAWIKRAASGDTQATAQDSKGPAGLIINRSSAGQPVSVERAVSLSSVYRALDILSTAGAQISMDGYRDGAPLPANEVPAIVRKPHPDMSRGDFVEQYILSMAAAGVAYFKIKRNEASAVIALEPLNPHEVTPELTELGRKRYHYRGTTLAQSEVLQLDKMLLPGAIKGLGPIQAARAELRGALNTRDYAAEWFDTTGEPAGILSTEAGLTAAEAKQYRDQWNGLDAEGKPMDQTDNPTRIRVLGKGLSYNTTMLSPSDAQWLEAQKFNTTQVSRMFGVPASLMLAAVEGNSQTYSNVEQDWLAFVRFTLIKYLGKLETALTDLVPRGQSVKFNVEALLRADTTTRYKGHVMALGRWMTVDEIRAIENLPPLTEAQRAELKDTPAAAPETTMEEAS